MKNLIINIIYKIISLIDYIDYHYIKKEKLIDNYKTTEEIILNDIEILSDTGYKSLYSITITKPFDIYSIELENAKTKTALEILNNLKLNDTAMFVTKDENENLVLATRNLGDLNVILSKNINVLEILRSKYLVVTEDAIADIEEALK